MTTAPEKHIAIQSQKGRATSPTTDCYLIGYNNTNYIDASGDASSVGIFTIILEFYS